MQVDNNGNQAGNSKNRKILVIICIYFFFTATSKYSQQSEHSGLAIRDKILNGVKAVQLRDIADVFDFEEPYQGVWTRTGDTQSAELQAAAGRVDLRFAKQSTGRSEDTVRMELNFWDGDYIDRGNLHYAVVLSSEDFVSEKTERNQFKLRLNDTVLEGSFSHEQIMQSKGSGVARISEVVFSFTLRSGNVIETTLELASENCSFLVESMHESETLLQTVLFAAVLFLISYVPFTGLARVLGGLHSGEDSVKNYSLGTACLASMWDAVICMVTFIFAFSDQVLRRPPSTASSCSSCPP